MDSIYIIAAVHHELPRNTLASRFSRPYYAETTLMATICVLEKEVFHTSHIDFESGHKNVLNFCGFRENHLLR